MIIDNKNVMYEFNIGTNVYFNELTMKDLFDRRELIKESIKKTMDLEAIEVELREKYEFDSMKMRVYSDLYGKQYVQFQVYGEDEIDYEQLKKDIIHISLKHY